MNKYFSQSLLNWIFHNRDNLNKEQEDQLMINEFQTTNYGLIGEKIFEKYILLKQLNYESQFKIDKFRLDYKVMKDKKVIYYEIKTRRYNMTGTAGEKILNVPHKYKNIIKTDNDNLVIVLIGLFPNDEQNQKYITFFKQNHTKFVKFTDLLIKHCRQNIKPFLKWVGGKSWLTEQLSNLILSSNKHEYVEPFIGGGSVMFDLLNKEIKFKKIVINDLNGDLINVYTTIKYKVDELITELNKLQFQNSSDEYYKLRDEYNKLNSCVRKAALFIYLNKTCFRGLYRTNKSGEFNVPYGNYKSINFDYNNIKLVSDKMLLYNVEIRTNDYTNLEYNNCITYLDPPYYNTFNDYSSVEFDHERFFDFINSNSMNEIIVSNSFDFITFIPIKFDNYVLTVNDMINSKTPNSKRYEILMIKNESNTCLKINNHKFKLKKIEPNSRIDTNLLMNYLLNHGLISPNISIPLGL